ncbi:MAG TPA: hypothetical protein VFG68_23880 [Fimbriiglobus sp.]|nr:hypothetical protein [Fimbriiglobus sp.]
MEPRPAIARRADRQPARPIRARLATGRARRVVIRAKYHRTVVIGAVAAVGAMAFGFVLVMMVTPGASAARPRPPVADAADATPVADVPARRVVRDLDAAAARELTRAWESNPLAAKDYYSNVRWRVRIEYIREFGGWAHTVQAAQWGWVWLRMRNEEDIKRVDRNTPFWINVIIRDWTPGQYYVADMTDAVFTDPP